jgi:class 3 adenylate cyclase/predicted ATPase
VNIAAWLEGLGLGRYIEPFAANDIDGELLRGLGDADLKELGVLSLGHRKKLLAAIAALADAPPAPAPPRAAERRQLTVMLVDLVGSTELSGRLDPEELAELLKVYQNTVTGEVTRFEGHVAKLMGDGVLCYFGWPRAHEDEAERAVRAGLAIAQAVARLEADGAPLACRVGIATGAVVVGDLVGEGAAQEEAVVGETPNLAARLQQLAPPGGVVVSRRTRRLVRGLFELEDLGPHRLKGFAEPVPAWRVLGERRSEGRFEARHEKGLVPLVGREQELALLLDRWRQARDGEGQVVLLTGEPGIGKSRLVRALRERLAGEAHTPLSQFCSPFHQTSALHPVIELLERAAGLARDEPPAEALRKLEAVLARGTDDVARAAPLIAALLGIPAGERYPPLELSPERRKEATLEVLLAQLEGLAAREPVLDLYEDVQWADPSTLELLGRVITQAPRLSVLVLITARPDFAPPWPGRAHVTALTLSRLSRSRGATLVAGLTRGKPLPEDVLEAILARTDGVPLFVEELTKTVLESGLLVEGGDRWALDGPLPPLAIPATLRDSLMARLDRLAPVKEVAQLAACLGREFSYELLAAVTPLDERGLGEALLRLAEAELILAHGAPPHPTYAFKHALVRDAAYDSLLKSRRQQLHQKIAQVLETRFPETAEAEPELLAHHCSEAGLADKAVAYWLAAGQHSVARSAMAEAIEQLTRGLELLAGLADDQKRRRMELGLQATLAAALAAAKGFAAAEAGAAWARARALCQSEPGSPLYIRVLQGQCQFHTVRAELEAASDIAAEMLRHGKAVGDPTAELWGRVAAGVVSLALGEPETARALLDGALALDDPAWWHRPEVHHAIDPHVWAQIHLSMSLFVLGHPGQARQRMDRAITEARELRHTQSLAMSLFWGCLLEQWSSDRRAAIAHADELIALATEQAFALWLARAEVVRGWALARVGAPEAGLVQLRRGLDAYRATGARYLLPYFEALLAEAQGQPAEARTMLDDALARAERTSERWLHAELHRRRGEALLALDPARAAEVEGCYRRALEIARAQGARMWELRAATSLARLWQGQGRRAGAHALLAPVHAWFTEGHDLPDLIAAKALLDALA